MCSHSIRMEAVVTRGDRTASRDELRPEELGEISAWVAGLIGEGGRRELDIGLSWGETRYRERAVSAGGLELAPGRGHELEVVIHVLGDERPAALADVPRVLQEECGRDATLGGRVRSAEVLPGAAERPDRHGVGLAIPLRITTA